MTNHHHNTKLDLTTSSRPSMDRKDSDPVIAVIYTGGTIGMRGDPLMPMTQTDFIDLLSSVRGFERSADGQLYLVLPSVEVVGPKRRRIELEFIGQIEPLDSSLIIPLDWANIAREVAYADDNLRYTGVVVLHGTDTLAWTASALSFLLGDLRVPVVLTGSQSPLGRSRTDALRNLITAVEFAAESKCPKEVCIFFDQVLLRGNRATKSRSSDFDGFETPNLDPLAKAGVELYYPDAPTPRLPLLNRTSAREWGIQVRDVRVLVIRVFPGMNTFPNLSSSGERMAVVLEAYGAGTASGDGGLKDFLETAKTHYGAPIVLRTQVPNGAIDRGLYGAAEWLKDYVIPCSDITSEACTAKLYYLLGSKMPPARVEQDLRTSLRGETLGSEPSTNNGRKTHYSPYTETMRLGARLLSRLSVVPDAIIEPEVQIKGVRIDFVATRNGMRTGIECSGGGYVSAKASADVDRLIRSGVDQFVVVGEKFMGDAELIVTRSGGRALTWNEAFIADWSEIL